MVKMNRLFLRVCTFTLGILLFVNSFLSFTIAKADENELVLLPKGSEWSYLDNGSDQGVEWRNPTFDDEEWKKGNGPFGYPQKEERPYFGSIQTMIEYGDDSKNKYATTYFRTSFQVEDLSKIGNAGLIKAGIDDGVVLYLNGQEIARYNLPEGEIPYNGYGQDYGLDYAPEGRYETFELDESHLQYIVEGTNVLAAEVHQDRPSSSDVYWDMELTTFNQSPEDLTVYNASYIAFSPGKNETEYNFSWYSKKTDHADYVQYAPKSMMNGGEFPVEHATTVQATLGEASSGYSSHKATITGMKQSTEYVYRLGDGKDAWTKENTFTTRNTDSYQFLFVGDPQIGSSKNIEKDFNGWNDTLNKAFNKFPNNSFILSAGDQVNKSTSEEEYGAYFAPSILQQFPIATTVGNHDDSVYYRYHFNVPNESGLGATDAGGDYYFTHGDTLFMVLNTNNPNGDQHRAFIREATEATPNAKWKVVMFHQSIYSAAKHSQSSSIVSLREQLYPVMDEYEIDIVLSGHDHSYVRTHQMLGNEPQLDQVVDEDGRVINPTGTLYLTANSSSGSKFYDMKPDQEYYAAVREQLAVPTFTQVEVTPTSFAFTTYRTDTMAITDTYTIVKEEESELNEVQLSVNEDVLSDEVSNLQLTLNGLDQKGKDFTLPSENIVYHTDQTDIISISESGKIEKKNALAEDATVQVWATIEVDGKQFESNQIKIQVLASELENELENPKQEDEENQPSVDDGELDENNQQLGNGPNNNGSTSNKGNVSGSNVLPNTATSYYNWVFFGTVLIMIGMSLPVIGKIRKAKSE